MRYFLPFVSLVAVYASAVEDNWQSTLLKRQAPGTPAYDCHLNCGTAITLSREPNLCTNSTFLDDYSDCIVCAGPENQNIWQYYGGTLTTAGAKCGLPTTPSSSTNTTASSSGNVGSSNTAATSSEASNTSHALTTTSSQATTSPGLPTSSRSGSPVASASTTPSAGTVNRMKSTFAAAVFAVTAILSW